MPPTDSPPSCARCQQLEDQWLQSEQMAFDQLQTLSDSNRQLQERCQQLQESLQEVEANRATEARHSAEALAEATGRQQDLEDENELLLQQLRQLQEELATTFLSLQEQRQQHQTLLAEQQELQQECGYLFRHCALREGLDRRRIARILALVRQSLQG
ncbi:MAG: hypothetical protein ACKOXO_04245 [Cyanobium sp.]